MLTDFLLALFHRYSVEYWQLIRRYFAHDGALVSNDVSLVLVERRDDDAEQSDKMRHQGWNRVPRFVH